MADMMRLTGLWKNKTRGGEDYLAGNLTPSIKLLVFANKRQVGDNDPAYIVYLAPKEKPATPGYSPEPARGETGDLPF